MLWRVDSDGSGDDGFEKAVVIFFTVDDLLEFGHLRFGSFSKKRVVLGFFLLFFGSL